MTVKEARDLKPGDEVLWTDPDDGGDPDRSCTRWGAIKHIHIPPMEESDGFDTIISITWCDDSCLEAYACELTRNIGGVSV